jgi:hypothetical protein
MSLKVVDGGESLALQYLTNKAASPQDLVLCLYTNNHTPADADVIGTYTEASGSGYANVTLTGASWTVRAAYDFTDLAIDATLNTKVTSASHNFVSTDVGRVLRVDSGTGFTAGTYRIVSVASNAAVLDRAVGTTSSTGGSFHVATCIVYAAQTFTFTGALGNVYGYFLKRASGGEFVLAELFSDGPYNIQNNGDTITVTPQISAD